MTSGSSSSPKNALGHLRVIEIGEDIGEFCCKTMADMGADVIRVEPRGGSKTREIGPFLNDSKNPEQSLHFWAYNLNKRSITLDLDAYEGQEVLKKLIKKSDILVESTPHQWMDERNLGYEELQKVNPKIVYVSISPFGRKGPKAHHKGGEFLAWASSGYMFTTGWSWQKPTHPWGRQASHTSGLYAVTGAMAAIFERRITGRGKFVDVSMQKSVASTVEQNVAFYVGDEVIPGRRDNDHVMLAGTFKLIECKDGWIHLNIGTGFSGRQEVIEWMKEEGMAEDLTDEKWLNRKYFKANIRHAVDVITKWAKLKTRDEFFRKGQERGMEIAPIAQVSETFTDPQLLSREFWVEVEHPELENGQSFTYPGPPYLLSDSPWKTPRRAPLIGEDNDEVYQDILGLTPYEQQTFSSEKII